jgi:hypothetical protein
MKEKYEVKENRIFNAQTKQLICTIWSEGKVSEERLEGESWLDMYERTKPERKTMEDHTKERASAVCDFLNSQTI